MSELRPLLECSDDELERALLGAVRADRPSAAGLRETALALGLSAGTAHALAATLPTTSTLGAALAAESTATAATVGKASATAGSSALSGAAAATASTVGAVTLTTVGKSLLGGALLSFVALSAVDRALDTTGTAPVTKTLTAVAPSPDRTPLPEVASPAQLVASSQPTPAPVVSAPAGAVGVRRAPSAETELPTAPPSSRAPARAAFEPIARPEPAPGAPTDASLAAEIRELDRARAALTAGNLTEAGRALDSYASSRPSSVLTQEAELLRVRLLLARGERAAAAQLARNIIARHPESAHVDSLRRLAAEP
jgi:hypothetical protein